MQDRKLHQAGHGSRVSTQGQWLVCHRLQGRQQAGRSTQIVARNLVSCGDYPCCTGCDTVLSQNRTNFDLKKYFITGLLIWVPLAITIWVLAMIIRTMDQSLLFLPEALRPEHIMGFYLPGIGAIATLLIVLVTGVVATNIVGQRFLLFWEGVLSRIPVVKSVYQSVKQVSDTLLGSSGEGLRKVLLVRYPHPEAWAIAFQTNIPVSEVSAVSEDELVGVFIPTAPSPVNGFFFFVRKCDTIELSMSVDSALKYIISMGVVVPASPLHPLIENPAGRAQNE